MFYRTNFSVYQRGGVEVSYSGGGVGMAVAAGGSGRGDGGESGSGGGGSKASAYQTNGNRCKLFLSHPLLRNL